MNWLQERIAALRWRRRMQAMPLDQTRLVVVDVETTGLDTERDELLAIGAVVVRNGAIELGEQFDCTLQREKAGAVGSILIHEIAPDALAKGREPRRALQEFLHFLGDSPAFAFHAPFDRRVLQRALRTQLGCPLTNPFIDIADLAPLLLKDSAPKENFLDNWLRALDLEAGSRHNAAADAMVTAELLLVLLQRARKEGLYTLGELLAWAKIARRLRSMRTDL